MKQLSKSESKDKQDHIDKLNDLKSKLEDEISKFNETKNTAFEKVKEALDAYNEAVSDANNFRDDIASQQQDYYDEKSERWQEGDAGSAYSNWHDTWEEELEQAEIDDPEDIDTPDLSAPETLEGYPDEVDG